MFSMYFYHSVVIFLWKKVLEKVIVKIRQFIFVVFFFILTAKIHCPLFKQDWISFILMLCAKLIETVPVLSKNFFFLQDVVNVNKVSAHWKRTWFLIWMDLNSIYGKMICAIFYRKWCWSSSSEDKNVKKKKNSERLTDKRTDDGRPADNRQSQKQTWDLN